MQELTLKDLEVLNSTTKGPMLSLYISVETSLHDQKPMKQRWNDLINKAEFLLLKDYPRSEVDEFLKSLRDEKNYLDKMGNLDKGIVVFHSKSFLRGSTGYLKLQSEISDLVVVSESFHIKPLLRIKNNFSGFFVVSMSSRAINVMIENQGHLVRIDSYRNEPGLLNKEKKDSKSFFEFSAVELNKLFSAYRLPIVLVGVKNHVTRMRRSLNQGMLVEEAVIGNVEKMKMDELTERVYSIMGPYYSLLEEKISQELEKADKEDLLVTYLEDIAVVASLGKIKKLYVVEKKHVWGNLNAESGEITISPKQLDSKDDDLLDDIGQLVLAKGGDVVVVRDSNFFNGYYAAAILLEKSHLENGVINNKVLTSQIEKSL